MGECDVRFRSVSVCGGRAEVVCVVDHPRRGNPEVPDVRLSACGILRAPGEQDKAGHTEPQHGVQAKQDLRMQKP